jgi:hypothetical protein
MIALLPSGNILSNAYLMGEAAHTAMSSDSTVPYCDVNDVAGS